jgi:hypothetical protein
MAVKASRADDLSAGASSEGQLLESFHVPGPAGPDIRVPEIRMPVMECTSAPPVLQENV